MRLPLPPSPGRLASVTTNAASDVTRRFTARGYADLRPMPSTVIDSGPQRTVHHYKPGPHERTDAPPILLVPPLAAPALCYDLRRGCSLVEHLIDQGRRTYLVDYGQISYADRRLGIEAWIEEILPKAIRAVSEHSGGGPVHLVSWSMGGQLAMLTAADQPELPIASIVDVAAPIDYHAIPMMAPYRRLANVTRGAVATTGYRMAGGIPKWAVQRGYQFTGLPTYLTKPMTVWQNQHDHDFLAQIEAVDRFTANMTAYPGRAYGQLFHRFYLGNDLARGQVDVEGRHIELANVAVPVLVIAGSTDTIAPKGAVLAVTSVLTGSPRVESKIGPGGHLGVLTGRAARGTTWAYIDEFTDSVDATPPVRAQTAAETTPDA